MFSKHKKHLARVLLILSAGWTTVLMQQFIRVQGGGMSLVFILSVPLQIGLSIVLAPIYHIIQKKKTEPFVLNLVTFLFVSLLILLAIVQYPFYR